MVVRYSGHWNYGTLFGMFWKPRTPKAVGFGQFVWPDIGDIDSVERLSVVEIFLEPHIERWSRIVELEWAQEVDIQSSKQLILARNGIRIWRYCSLWTDRLVNRSLHLYFLFYYNNSHTRNSVTMSCNSVTEQNLLIANNQYTYYDQTFVHCIATSDTYQILLVIGNNW